MIATVLVAPKDIHARRRPAAILFVYAYELMWALLVAAPFHSWARRVFGAHPDGDAPLFEPGGLDFVSWLTGNEVALGEAVRTTMLLLWAGAIIAQLPLGVLIAALATTRNGRGPRTGDALSMGWRSLPALFTVLLFTSLVQILVVGLGGGAAYAIDRAMKEKDATGAKLAFVVLALFVVLAFFVGVLGDLWRVACVRMLAVDDPPKMRTVIWRSFKLAFRLKGLGGAFVGWSLRGIAGIAVIYVGSIVSGLSLPLILTFSIHQLAIALRVGLRASWLAQALRVVGYRASDL